MNIQFVAFQHHNVVVYTITVYTITVYTTNIQLVFTDKKPAYWNVLTEPKTLPCSSVFDKLKMLHFASWTRHTLLTVDIVESGSKRIYTVNKTLSYRLCIWQAENAVFWKLNKRHTCCFWLKLRTSYGTVTKYS